MNAATDENEVQAARRILLKAVWQASGLSQFNQRFKSSAIDLDGYFSSPSFMVDTSTHVSDHIESDDFRKSIISASSLTLNEKQFLEDLLKSDDHHSIHKASIRLSDKAIFPPEEEEENSSKSNPNRKFTRREPSEFQNRLFRHHGRTRRGGTQDEIETEIEKDENSITRIERSWEVNSETSAFPDISSWIDGSQGVEIGHDGNPSFFPNSTSSPFSILGTSAEDTSCHPHILSPPLMDSLLAFFPDSLQCGYNFWLKYSLVRDGSPDSGSGVNRLLTMLRHCRASTNTILAIETEDGFVFGSFTSQHWRLLSSVELYGSKDTFVWRMRQSRNEPCQSVTEQVLRESKIDVFPYTSKNNKIQFCCKEFLALGEGELEDMDVQGNAGSHFGNAFRLDNTLLSGSTSNSETFDNPSLIHTDKRGEEFKVANVEVWTLTPHTGLESAVRSEMHNLFLEEKRQNKNLDLIEILRNEQFSLSSLMMSTRPFKKARLEAKSDSCHLGPFVQRLSTNDHRFNSNLGQIILILQDANSHVKQVSIWRLHKILLLYLGFFMPSKGRELRSEKLSLLSSCVLTLFKSKYSAESKKLIFEFEEANEVYSLALQLLKELNDSPEVLVSKQKSQKNCLSILEVTLQNLNVRKFLDRNRNHIEELFYVTLEANDQLKSPQWIDTFFNILRNQPFGSTSKRLVNIAKIACSGEYFTTKSEEGNEDLYFFLKCLPYSDNSKLWNGKVKANLKTLLRKTKDESFLRLEVIKCYCHLVEKWSLPDDCDETFDEVIDIMLYKSYFDEEKLSEFICFIQLITKRKSALGFLIRRKPNLVKLLTASAAQNNGLAEKAAEFVCGAASFLLSESLGDRESERKGIQIVFGMLFSESFQVIQKGVIFLRDLAHNDGKIWMPVILSVDGCVSRLAEISMNEFASKSTRRHTIEIFLNCIEMDPKNINSLAREPKVLESIVHVTLDQEMTNSHKLAVTIMFKMSKNVCNHRLLATQKGLLSSMICYTRHLSTRSGTQQAQVSARMKNQILCLAGTL